MPKNLTFLLFLCQYIGIYSITTSTDRSWHLFNDTMENIYIDTTKSSIASSIRGGWDTGFKNIKKKAYRELFVDYSLDYIFKHQNPIDCSNKQFLISSGYNRGYIHDIHVEGYGLAIALEMNRIYISSRRNTINMEMIVQNNSYVCHDYSSVDCYYIPWSNCTWADIDPIVFKQDNAIRTIRWNSKTENRRLYKKISDKTNIVSSGNSIDSQNEKLSDLIKPIIEKYKDWNVISINIHDKDSAFKRLVPSIFQNIVERGVIPEARRYYWWRAISATYLLRPNQLMKDMMTKYSLSEIADLKGHCVGVYVRQGRDKGGMAMGGELSITEDMEVLPFKDYSQVAGQLWDITYMDDDIIRKGTRTMVLGTDTPQVITDAIAWGEKRKWKIIFHPIMLNGWTIQSKGSRNLPHTDEYVANTSAIPSFMKTKKGVSLLEYTIFMTTLLDLMRCDSFVCTLAANYCRLLDEFRAMIAAKPENFYADLSAETCWEPPCVGPNKFKWFGW